MLKNIITLAKKFISIKSISGNDKALEEILELALSYLPDYTIERFIQDGMQSALVYNTKKRPKKFKLLLNGHLDIVPGKDYQYLPKIEGGRLYGAGSMDMKANAATLIMVFKAVAKKVDYSLGLQLVTDEQVGGFNGTKCQIDDGVRADFVIAGEPTNFDIANKEKGVLQLLITSHGKTAHSAYLSRGDNAIWKMNEFLIILRKKFSIPIKEEWKTTLNLSTIKTNNASFNKIPDDCTIGLDIRFIPGEAEEIVKNIKKLLPKGFDINIVVNESALFTDQNNEYLKILQKTGRQMLQKKILVRGAQGSSDVRHFGRVGCAGIEFGPIGGGIGSDKEWVDIPSLKMYYRILNNFLLFSLSR